MSVNLSFVTSLGGPAPCTTPGKRHGKSIKINATIESIEMAIVPAVRVVLS